MILPATSIFWARLLWSFVCVHICLVGVLLGRVSCLSLNLWVFLSHHLSFAGGTDMWVLDYINSALVKSQFSIDGVRRRSWCAFRQALWVPWFTVLRIVGGPLVRPAVVGNVLMVAWRQEMNFLSTLVSVKPSFFFLSCWLGLSHHLSFAIGANIRVLNDVSSSLVHSHATVGSSRAVSHVSNF